VAVVPFDAYGGAIYVPAVINGDSAWLMLDTGLSRTGLDPAWAKNVGIVPESAAATTWSRPLASGSSRWCTTGWPCTPSPD